MKKIKIKRECYVCFVAYFIKSKEMFTPAVKVCMFKPKLSVMSLFRFINKRFPRAAYIRNN